MDRWMIHSHEMQLLRLQIFTLQQYSGDQTLKAGRSIKNQFGSESYFDAVLVYFNNDQGDGVIIIVRPHEMRDMRKEEFYKSSTGPSAPLHKDCDLLLSNEPSKKQTYNHES
ncbi:hypothetical protein BY996DRAFT_8510599 [Phakopsora pachyrhizi]|nr:hypothetical protein BY996DRAFT_8510599 [Phakopsora pachyrhizi]